MNIHIHSAGGNRSGKKIACARIIEIGCFCS